MKLDFSTVSYDGKWYDFETETEVAEEALQEGRGYLKIRMYPQSLANITMQGGRMVITGEEQLKIFTYSLEEQRGFSDAKGQPFKLTDDVKKTIFDFNMAGIPTFVLRKTRLLDLQKRTQEGN